MIDDYQIRECIVDAIGLIPHFAEAYLSNHHQVIHHLRQVAYVLEMDDYLSPAEIGAATKASDATTPIQALKQIRKALRDTDALMEQIQMRLTPLLGKSLKAAPDEDNEHR